MSITLNKPLGTNIYDIAVFNANFSTIERYLNNFETQISEGIKVYYPSTINIDGKLESGIYICDNLQDSQLNGTFPSGIQGKQNFELVSYGEKGKSTVTQLFIDMTNYSSTNNIYFRCYVQDVTEETISWSNWKSITSTNGGSSESQNVFVKYPTSIDINNLDSGIYLCYNLTNIAGTFPNEVTNKSAFQIISYGDIDKESNIKTQVLTDLTNGNNISYTRCYYNTSSGFTWSAWKLVNEGGGGGGTGDVTAAGDNIFTGNNIFTKPVSVATPVDDNNVTNKAYVDNYVKITLVDL